MTRIGQLDAVLASDGVVQADTYLQVGETIRPVRRDGDRRGYVIATADTPEEALSRAELAATRLEVEVAAMSCSFDLEHYAEILEAAQRPAAIASRRSASHRRAAISSCATTSTSRSTRRSGWPSSRRRWGCRRRTSS